MRLVSTSISNLHRSQVKIIERDEQYFNSPFHYHPEFELVYIVEGFGKRIIGSKIEEFEKGEILLIGSNVPHVWISDKSFYTKDCARRSKAVVIYFNPKIFSHHFYEMEESFYLNKLFSHSQNGIKITGETKKANCIKVREVIKIKKP